jgi:uncharacterized protein YeaO (DUF488 family)
MPNTVRIKRAYEPPGDQDGFRVLVDRIWPRGVSKSSLKIDLWLKEIAPTTQLRKWFNHDETKWHEFQQRYQAELVAVLNELDCLRKQASHGPVTLVYGAKDQEHNQAVVLQEILKKSIPGGR